MLDSVIDIARAAGGLLLAGFRGERVMNFKSRAEIVTDMDLASERLIVQRLATRFPGHTIVTEEGGGREQSSPSVWLIDPLDGTSNYARGIPYWSVAIALLERERLSLGVVYDPVHDECFAATHDGPATLNGKPIRVSTITALTHAQLSTGFPYGRWQHGDSNAAEVGAMIMRCQDLRRTGSSALDLCYVAAGRNDGHWETAIQPWDGAAGALIAGRAGGVVTALDDSPYTPWKPPIAASNGLIHREMLDALAAVKNRV